ncbi:peptide-methionine (S)-S-oxide reductase [Pseudalgibacter alginicilyticus]|uniref:peptide-methionine (S)-S-oxide reductase n=1 Tax=Pseudalgibacter alginicilyticus TaxID=1736674 RepID=UPI000A486BCF
MKKLQKIGFGGGCHWCTEAIFLSLIGIEKVKQGYIASVGKNDSFSEAVIIHFNPKYISLKTLIEVHLLTHKSTTKHSMRHKYRSAIYTFYKNQNTLTNSIISGLQKDFQNQIITEIFTFNEFKASRQQITITKTQKNLFARIL